jgi:glycosyltransferase involved in cell wall biosynthesis
VDGLTEYTVSVVIPAHNEARTIADVVRGCAATTPGVVEVIVVDDGSADDTATFAKLAGAKVVRLEKNLGKGLAMQHGIREARGDILVFIDADGQDDPTEIPLLLSAFAPDVDLVLGSRFLGGFRPGAITRMNYLGTRFIRAAVNVLFRASVTDPLAGFRAVRSSVFDRIQLEARGYDVEVDLLLKVLQTGGLVAEVPAQRSARSYGASGLSSFRDGMVIMLRVVQLRLRRAEVASAASLVDSAGAGPAAEQVAQQTSADF